LRPVPATAALTLLVPLLFVNVRAQNATRQLLLETVLDAKQNGVFASATCWGGPGKGFGPGIFITCNLVPIVDTRDGSSRPNSGSFVTPMDSLYIWNYEGPDTSFEVEIKAASAPVITDSFSGKHLFLADSLAITYSPAGPCSALQLILGDEFQDSIRPITSFDSTTGMLYPLWIGSQGLQSGAGTIAVARIQRVVFSSPAFQWITVEDSAAGKPVEVLWQ
jgi:hypothetical protein